MAGRNRHAGGNAAAAAIVGALFVATMLLPTGAAAASCATDDPLTLADTARSIFVGRVSNVSDRGTVAAVEVDAVWQGPDLAPTVTVHGAEGGVWSVLTFLGATSVDVAFAPGQRYLFVVPGDYELVQVNACTVAPFGPELAARAPADARQPIAGGLDGNRFSGFRLLLGVGLVSAGGTVLVRRWRGQLTG